MKKLLAILLSLLLVLSLAACGGNGNDKDDDDNNGGNLIIGPGGSDEGNADGDTVSGGDVVAPPSGEKPSDEVLEAIEQYRKIILALQKYEPGGEFPEYKFEDFGFQSAEPIVGSKAILYYYSTLLSLEIIDPWMGTQYANTPNMLWDRQAAMENVMWSYQNYLDEHRINGIPDPSYSQDRTHGGFKRAGKVQGDGDTICLNDYLYVEIWPDTLEGDYEVQIILDFNAMLQDYKHRLAKEVPNVEIINKYRDPQSAAKALLQYMLPGKITSTSHQYNSELSRAYISGLFLNGDEISCSWEAITPELSNYKALLDVDFVYEDFTYTYAGKVPLEVIDLEQMGTEGWLCLEFTGANGAGTATASIFIAKEGYEEECPLEILGNNGALSNGDKITVKLSEYAIQELRLYNHMRFTPTQVEVEVTGLQ